jgi:hypothetical protein
VDRLATAQVYSGPGAELTLRERVLFGYILIILRAAAEPNNQLFSPPVTASSLPSSTTGDSTWMSGPLESPPSCGTSSCTVHTQQPLPSRQQPTRLAAQAFRGRSRGGGQHPQHVRFLHFSAWTVAYMSAPMGTLCLVKALSHEVRHAHAPYSKPSWRRYGPATACPEQKRPGAPHG